MAESSPFTQGPILTGVPLEMRNTLGFYNTPKSQTSRDIAAIGINGYSFSFG